jgi:DNA primase
MKGLSSVMLSVDARKSLEQAAANYHFQLGVAKDYLRARGISKATADMYRLGVVANPIIGDEQYVGRIAIPYITPTGVVDMRYRAMGNDDSPKYLSRPGAHDTMFSVTAFQHDSDVIAICEGEFDTMIVNGEVGVPAVGLSGANKWKNWYARAFQDYRKVLVLADGDQAGSDMGKRIAQSIDVAVVVSMPEGMDVTDVFLAEGADGIRRRVGL